MASLTTYFGNEIRAFKQPVDIKKVFSGFAGADGVVSMDLGTRGSAIIVNGRFRGETMADCQNTIDSAEAILFNEAKDYSHDGVTFEDVVWEKIVIVKDKRGKQFYRTETSVFCDFIAVGRSLI